jgi:catechol 2,3-dioxygenase-like lactoylglutathione lyase family enzyme
MPSVQGVLETSLYVEDLDRAATFYRSLFGFPTLLRDSRLCALNVSGRQVLLLFRRGGTPAPVQTPGGTIPVHEGAGRLHLAFAITRGDVPAWQARLRQLGIKIESVVSSPRGGSSVYFRDPDGHLVELVTPGTWEIF